MSADPKSTHYDAGGIETIEVIKAKLTPNQMVGYLLGNVIKYALRVNWKGDPDRDAEKLRQYAIWLGEAMPASGDDAVTYSAEYQHDDRPPDRPLASHCPDGGACRHKCGLEPCKGQS